MASGVPLSFDVMRNKNQMMLCCRNVVLALAPSVSIVACEKYGEPGCEPS
jgi:hypothetical protein